MIDIAFVRHCYSSATSDIWFTCYVQLSVLYTIQCIVKVNIRFLSFSTFFVKLDVSVRDLCIDVAVYLFASPVMAGVRKVKITFKRSLETARRQIL